MNKNITRIIALLCMAAFIAIMLIGCGGGDDTLSSTSSSSSSSSSGNVSSSSSSSSSIIPGMTSAGNTSDSDVSTSESSGGGLLFTTTSLPTFTRLDFGTKTRAEEDDMTSHQYIMSILEYDSEFIGVSFTEDSIIITALADGTFEATGEAASTADSDHFIRGTKTCYRPMNTFSLRFDNLVTFDYEGELRSGYGTWAGFPFTYKGVDDKDSWRGCHQYMKIRIKNNTENTAIAMQFNNSTAYASTQFAVMAVGAGKQDYETYIYDLCYASTYPSGKGVLLAGQNPGNNWTWKQNTQVTGLRFHLLGSTCSYANAYLNNIFEEGETAADYDIYYEYFKRLDTRAAIKKGNSVEIDYIVFGSDPKSLSSYNSFIESSSYAGA